MALTCILASRIDLPVIAAGGIMDGGGVSAAPSLGAAGARLAAAYVPTDENLADEG